MHGGFEALYLEIRETKLGGMCSQEKNLGISFKMTGVEGGKKPSRRDRIENLDWGQRKAVSNKEGNRNGNWRHCHRTSRSK